MATKSFAPRLTRVATSGVATAIASGEPIRVYGIILSKSGGTVVTFTFTNSDSTTLFTITLDDAVLAPIEINTPWIADNGLQISISAASAEAVVFHSHPGT